VENKKKTKSKNTDMLRSIGKQSRNMWSQSRRRKGRLQKRKVLSLELKSE